MNLKMEIDIIDSEEIQNSSSFTSTNHKMHEQKQNPMEIDPLPPTQVDNDIDIPTNPAQESFPIALKTNTNPTLPPSSNPSSLSLILQKEEQSATDPSPINISVINEEDYEAIAIMIDELLKDDPSVRIKAIRSLPIISKALGYERTRDELIPYLTQMIDDDDEVLLVFIEEIFRLKNMKLIGMDAEHMLCLIAPFERLCQVEEKIIRDEACQKFAVILSEMPYDNISCFDEHILPLFQRLCTSDWHTARISGASLIASVFSKFVSKLNTFKKQNINDTKPVIKEIKIENENTMDVDLLKNTKTSISSSSPLSNENVRYLTYKQHMLDFIKSLCDDDIPIVRRSAIISLGKMIHVLTDTQEVITEYLPLFLQLAKDDQDNVRVFAIDTLLQFHSIFTYEQTKNYLLHPIRQLLLDSAWRVRYISADKFISICHMLDSETICNSMINYFIRLLTDAEPEVRAVAISKIPMVSEMIGVKLSVEKLIPVVCELVVDENKYARSSLASIIIPFCHQLPHKIVIDHILKCILKILNDEYPNVRLHVISNICGGMGEESQENIENKNKTNDKKFDISLLEESILPSITELTLNGDWRVRLGIIEKFPALAKKFGMELFDKKLFNLCMASLEDTVADVRFSAASNLYVIANTFDEQSKHLVFDEQSKYIPYEWARVKCIPTLIKKSHACTNYLYRMVYLLSYQYLCESMGVELNDVLVVEIVDALEKDIVPNVRFKACQILKFLVLKGLIHVKHYQSIVPKLKHLMRNDNDQDVQYFAEKCYECVIDVYQE